MRLRTGYVMQKTLCSEHVVIKTLRWQNELFKCSPVAFAEWNQTRRHSVYLIENLLSATNVCTNTTKIGVESDKCDMGRNGVNGFHLWVLARIQVHPYVLWFVSFQSIPVQFSPESPCRSHVSKYICQRVTETHVTINSVHHK